MNNRSKQSQRTIAAETRAAESRRQKRRATIKSKGREVKIIHFLKTRAAALPEMTDKTTRQPIDHAANLHGMYMSKGIQGVNEYVRRVNAVLRRDMSPTITGRIAGWLLIRKLKFMSWIRR